MIWLYLLGCPQQPGLGVYSSGANAIVLGEATRVTVWGAEGSVERVGTPGPQGYTYLGEKGPLWRVNRTVEAPPKPPTVPAALVERSGIRLRRVLQLSGPAVDAARPGGVYVRSIVKTRQRTAPPILVLTGTGDDVGAGRFGGPADVRAGNNCKAAIVSVDADAEKLLSSHELAVAEQQCAVPYLLGPVDRDGDGGQDFLVYGQEGKAGFRAWFELKPDGTLVSGPSDSATLP